MTNLIKLYHYDFGKGKDLVSIINPADIFEIVERDANVDFSKRYVNSAYCKIYLKTGTQYTREYNVPGNLWEIEYFLKDAKVVQIYASRRYKDPNVAKKSQEEELKELVRDFGGSVRLTSGEEEDPQSGTIQIMTGESRGRSVIGQDPFSPEPTPLPMPKNDDFEKNLRAMQQSIISSTGIPPGSALLTNGDPSKSTVIRNVMDE